MNSDGFPAMPLVDCLRLIQAARSDQVVITSMGVAREWMLLPGHPLDFHFVPSSMGQATSLGLGLALAQPQRRVIVCVGDGALLMNLGSLVSITAAAPTNLTTLLFDNGVYEVTGGQTTAASFAGRRQRVDFAALARACGVPHVDHLDRLDALRAALPELLQGAGPSLAVLQVAPVPGAVGPKSPGPAAERFESLRRQLGAS